MNQDRTVTLAGKDYPIKAIDLGSLRLIGMGSAKTQKATQDLVVKEGDWYEGTFDVLAAALDLAPAEVEGKGRRVAEQVIAASRAELLKIEGVTVADLIAASKKIYVLTGLVTEKDPQAGEAKGAVTG